MRRAGCSYSESCMTPVSLSRALSVIVTDKSFLLVDINYSKHLTLNKVKEIINYYSIY